MRIAASLRAESPSLVVPASVESLGEVCSEEGKIAKKGRNSMGCKHEFEKFIVGKEIPNGLSKITYTDICWKCGALKQVIEYQEAARTGCWSSVVKMDWACGHKGRGYCLQCHDDAILFLKKQIKALMCCGNCIYWGPSNGCAKSRFDWCDKWENGLGEKVGSDK